MIRPPPGDWAFIIRNACWAHRNAPVRLVSTMRCQSASASSSTAPPGPNTPALLTSRSSRPQRSLTASNSRATDSGAVTSAGTASADPAGAPARAAEAAVWASASPRRPASATRHPAPSRAPAMCRPTPEPAPVTTATPVVAMTASMFGRSVVERGGAGRHVDRVLPERLQRHDVQGPLMGGGQHHGRGDAVAVGPQPVGRGHAPAVPGHQPGEGELGDRGAEVVADPALVVEELGGHHGADRVTAPVLRPGVAAAVPVEAGDRVRAARLQLAAQHIPGAHGSSIGAAGPARQAPAGPGSASFVR